MAHSEPCPWKRRPTRPAAQVGTPHPPAQQLAGKWTPTLPRRQPEPDTVTGKWTPNVPPESSQIPTPRQLLWSGEGCKAGASHAHEKHHTGQTQCHRKWVDKRTETEHWIDSHLSRSLSLFYLIDLGVVTSVISDVMSRVRLVALHTSLLCWFRGG